MYCGHGFYRFAEGKYEEAARIFEKVCRLHREGERMEIIHSCLGRCYLAIGKNDEALENLSTAYHLFHKNRVPYRKGENSVYPNEYMQMIEAYSEVLLRLGQTELAEKIAKEAEESHITRH